MINILVYMHGENNVDHVIQKQKKNTRNSKGK